MAIEQSVQRAPIAEPSSVGAATYEIVRTLYNSLVQAGKLDILNDNLSREYYEISLSRTIPPCPIGFYIEFWKTTDELHEKEPEFASGVSSGCYDSEGEKHCGARFFDAWPGRSFFPMIQNEQQPYFTIRQPSRSIREARILLQQEDVSDSIHTVTIAQMMRNAPVRLCSKLRHISNNSE